MSCKILLKITSPYTAPITKDRETKGIIGIFTSLRFFFVINPLELHRIEQIQLRTRR